MPTLSITVQRVAFPPSTAPAESWYILITSQGTCKGKMSWRPQDGEALTLEGEYTTYKGSREFAFSSARLNIPTNSRDQLTYVVARTIGLGPAAESLIWSTAGEHWQDIQPGDVPRLSGKIYESFRLQCESLASKSEEARVVAALMGRGCTDNMASKAWAMWKDETLGVVGSDPYRLAELDSYGFRDVDGDVRRSYEIGDSDVRRVRAAVVYALRRLTANGDTVALWVDLYREATGLLCGFANEVSECTRGMFEDGTLKAFKDSEGVSLAADFRAESDVWNFVCGNNEGEL